MPRKGRHAGAGAAARSGHEGPDPEAELCLLSAAGRARADQSPCWLSALYGLGREEGRGGHRPCPQSQASWRGARASSDADWPLPARRALSGKRHSICMAPAPHSWPGLPSRWGPGLSFLCLGGSGASEPLLKAAAAAAPCLLPSALLPVGVAASQPRDVDMPILQASGLDADLPPPQSGESLGQLCRSGLTLGPGCGRLWTCGHR